MTNLTDNTKRCTGIKIYTLMYNPLRHRNVFDLLQIIRKFTSHKHRYMYIQLLSFLYVMFTRIFVIIFTFIVFMPVFRTLIILKCCDIHIIWRNSTHTSTDKSLARPGRKQATATEDFEFHISYLLS